MLAPRSQPLLVGILSLGLTLSVLGVRQARAQEAAGPCHQDPRYEALARWVGEWQMVNEAGQLIGRSTVRSILAGCALEETRSRSDGSEEIGLTFLDLATNSWRQRSVSSLGHTGLFELSFEDGGVAIRGSFHTADGGEAWARARVTARPGGGFDETVEISTDGGKVYSAALSTSYLPQGELSAKQATPDQPAPTPAPTPAPSPTAPAASAAEPAAEVQTGVKVRSKRKAEAPIQDTAMESPMTLEIELGPLADLPPGAAWRTTELAPYVADQVNIPRVTAQTRQRKGSTELQLVVNLRTRAGKSKVDLDVSLLSDETVVASERVDGIALGKLIRAHDPQDGLAQTVRLVIEPEAFVALFAGGKRPSARLTVTVR